MARERERILMSMAMNWKKHENERRGEGGSEEEQEEEGGRRHRSRLELSPELWVLVEYIYSCTHSLIYHLAKHKTNIQKGGKFSLSALLSAEFSRARHQLLLFWKTCREGRSWGGGGSNKRRWGNKGWMWLVGGQRGWGREKMWGSARS